MNPKVKLIRRQLKNYLDFDFWVRHFDNGLIWCGASFDTQKRMERIVSALIAEGYQPETNGKPGTAGAYIVEIRA